MRSHGDKSRRDAYVKREGRFWKVVFPAPPDEGMDTATGPFLTRWGARFSLWFWGLLG